MMERRHLRRPLKSHSRSGERKGEDSSPSVFFPVI